MAINITAMIGAVAALGTASYGLVDATKALNGGLSNAGFVYIRRVISLLFPNDASSKDSQSPLALGTIEKTLKANWINGTPLEDQKAIAKTLIKLRLNAANAASLAQKLGVDAAVLSTVAAKMVGGQALTQGEADVLGRFDLILTTALDEGYQRADQRYRNWCKGGAVLCSIILAMASGVALHGWSISHRQILEAFIVGLLATPLAPVAKDLSSAVQAAAKAVQVLRG